VQVLEILREKELCFSDILQITGGLKSNLSQHLTVMCKSGILSMRRSGQCNYYRISKTKILKADKLFREVLREQIEFQQGFFA
jgi:DNA-binding transcriptional ArsR family regulator